MLFGYQTWTEQSLELLMLTLDYVHGYSGDPSLSHDKSANHAATHCRRPREDAEEQKGLVVPLAHAVQDPGAVVVHPLVATPAL